MTAPLTEKFNEAAAPKVQLEQAIGDAQEQHGRSMDQAANVIANQKQTEMRLNRAMGELEKVNGSARQALLMADDATKKGDADKAAQYNQAAEAFANRLIAVEKEVDSLKTLSLQSAQAADQAKAAVQQNSAALQKKLSERQKLLSQLDQAKMQEQMNVAMQSLSQTVGQDTPTLDEVDEPGTEVGGQVARLAARPVLHPQGRVAHQAFGEHAAVLVADLDGGILFERALDIDDPGRQQGSVTLDQGPPGAFVHDDR